jgi:hypothetical protein
MDEVRSIVEACTRYWRRTRVPKQAIAEMREELESHLRDAVAEGKPVASVIGEDETVFAEQWAREYRPPYVRPSSWARVGPALLALLVGGWMFWLSAGIDTSMEYVRECCPWTVVERTTEPSLGGEFFYRVTIAAAGLSILAAILVLFGQFAWGSAALALGAVAAAIMPPGWVVSLILIAALVWARLVARRAYRVRAPAPTLVAPTA